MSAPSPSLHSSATPEWMQRKERGSVLLLRFMTWLSLRLGRPLTRPIVFGIALYFLLAVPRARAASQSYLQRCLGRAPRWVELYQHIVFFAITIHDRLFLLNDRCDIFDVRIVGDDPFLQAANADRGFLLFGAHLGSFEALRCLARQNLTREICIAMYPENARQLNAQLAAINPQIVQQIIPLGQIDAMLTLREKVSTGSVAALLADRASGSDTMHAQDFLGAAALFPSGPFRLAALLRSPVYFMAGIYRGGNRYDLHFTPLADFTHTESAQRAEAIQAAQKRYADVLAEQCRLAPFNWFNFYDFWETAADGSP
jgi:predicted LPLAT superfamily acyltransferase